MKGKEQGKLVDGPGLELMGVQEKGSCSGSLKGTKLWKALVRDLLEFFHDFCFLFMICYSCLFMFTGCI